MQPKTRKSIRRANLRTSEILALPGRAVRFYIEGFRSMTVGRTLWAIILLKLLILFGVLRPFFFADPMAGKSPEQRTDRMLKQLAPLRTFPERTATETKPPIP